MNLWQHILFHILVGGFVISLVLLFSILYDENICKSLENLSGYKVNYSLIHGCNIKE